MKRALTVAEMRAVDAAAATHGMPGGVLMENAGTALTQAALTLASAHGRFLVLCGTGNNGGDGLVVARQLAAAGRAVLVELLGAPTDLRGEPARNLEAMQAVGLTPAPIPADAQVGEGDVVIDAIFGTGLSRAPAGVHADAIGRIAAWRATGAKVLAADLPSGLESDTGVPFTPCVTADQTLALGFLKVGQAIEPGATRCGALEVIDIGIPRAAHQVLREPRVSLLEENDVRERIPVRRVDANKGTFGHVLVVAGSRGKTGAAALSGLGALRGGAGLVTVATRPEALGAVLAHAPELMGVELVNDGPLGLGDLNALLEAADRKTAVVIGPGIARGPDTVKLLAAFLEALAIPCVLDADALNAIAGAPGLLERAKGGLLLTPHPGEMARLVGRTVPEVQGDRIAVARAFAKERRVVLMLKGARTVVALPSGEAFINPTGNPGMATGGTGDVLSGLCGALLAQGLSVGDAALCGAYVHGLAGDLAARRHGQMGLIASDLLAGLGEVWSSWKR